MTATTYYTERPAAVPMAAPVGAVVVGLGSGSPCASPFAAAHHGAAFGNASGNVAKTWMTGTDRKIPLMTTPSARHLGRRST